MNNQELQNTIDAAWEARDGINAQTTGEIRIAVETALTLSIMAKSASPNQKKVINLFGKLINGLKKLYCYPFV